MGSHAQAQMLRPGDKVDRFLVEQLLGEGGVGRVYRVRHRTLGTVHALKILAIDTRRARARAVREAQVQAVLGHPNVVTVSDTFEVDGRPCLLMDLVEGPALDRWLAQTAARMREAVALFRGVLAGTEYAHGKGLVHRDLKPANILLDIDSDGSVVPKVTDFGLVKVLDLDGGAAATRTGMVLGTPAYGSPEQLLDPRSVDARSDLFSLGCVLYELCCGQRAFRGTSIPVIYAAVSEGLYPPPKDVVPDLPAPLVELIDGLLEPNRDLRLHDLTKIRTLLDEAYEGGEDRLAASWAGAKVARELAHKKDVQPYPSSVDSGTTVDIAKLDQIVAVDIEEAATSRVPLLAVAFAVGVLLLAIGFRQTSDRGEPGRADVEDVQVVDVPAPLVERPSTTERTLPLPVERASVDAAVEATATPEPAAVVEPATDGTADAVLDKPSSIDVDSAEPEAIGDAREPAGVVALGALPASLDSAVERVLDRRGLTWATPGDGDPLLALAAGSRHASEVRERWPDAPLVAVDVDPGFDAGPTGAVVGARPDPAQLVSSLRVLIPGLSAVGAIHSGKRDPWWRDLQRACEDLGLEFVLGTASDSQLLRGALNRVMGSAQVLVMAPDPSLWSAEALAMVYTDATTARKAPFPVVGFETPHLRGTRHAALVALRSSVSRDALAAEAAESLLAGQTPGPIRFPDLVLIARDRRSLMETDGVVLNRRSSSRIHRWLEP